MIGVISASRIAAVAVGLALAGTPGPALSRFDDQPSAGQPVHHTVTVDGHPIAVWEKRAAHPKRSVLLVHGRTWSSLPDFDLQVPGEHLSAMNAPFVRILQAGAAPLSVSAGNPDVGVLPPIREAIDGRLEHHRHDVDAGPAPDEQRSRFGGA